LKQKSWKIPLYKISNSFEDISSISKVIKRGMDWAIGPEIIDLENNLANYIGSKYCVAFNSGTSAGHAALLSLNFKKNDEIHVPSFSFIATANWPLMVGCKPKFIDIEKKTYGLDPLEIKKHITKRTKAILPIHYAGLPCQIQEINRIAKKNNIPLIEDAAESLGSEINRKKIGSFGEIGVFSFAANKIITAGEGGAVVTNSKTIYEKLKLIRSHGRKTNVNYFSSVESPSYVNLGYNWRMSSITAALISSQLSKIDKLITKRRKHAKYYVKHLEKFEKLKFHQEPKNYKHVYQLFPIKLSSKYLRDNLMEFLSERGIMTKIFFEPIHKTTHFKKQKIRNLNLKTTEKISEQILSLPMYPDLKKEELNEVISSVSEFLELND